MLKTGFVGWRGAVGTVLMQRMKDEGDFSKLKPYFFSTSQVGKPAPDYGQAATKLLDAYSIKDLKTLDAIISIQGGEYTNQIYYKLRQEGWNGYWIDASSSLRLKEDSVIALDPINALQIRQGLKSGVKNYIGGNCTVSLMLMAIHGMLKEDLVDWIQVSTYQAISGAGSLAMKELFSQISHVMQYLSSNGKAHASGLDLEKNIHKALATQELPTTQIDGVLANNILPWIDQPESQGQTREEWKGFIETNKILGRNPPIPVDSTCVRVATLRCHCQAITMKLKHNIALQEVEQTLKGANPWVEIVPNERQSTLNHLTPVAVADSLKIKVGRLRKLHVGPNFIQMFTVGDQLLWGAAEPIRRVLLMVVEYTA